MKQTYRACKKCKRLTVDKNCVLHPEEITTEEWFGYVIINEPKFSEIAKASNITEQGKYAIKVRQ
ncbi:MAG: DNA-directed RNA polymerase subunit E'' [Candidatus Thermoplasmatota archaeon]|nr:DNA-directed RNA polymerase subunit E'' [Candidatus Thermoplasmatota archaeon]MCL5794405.1 DNA-directed RNA polymerase subunit E'' [Candidatus Thermoplasmatota archaeon]